MPDVKTVFTDPFKGIDLNRLIGLALEERADLINELNQQQLDKGLDSKGKDLGPYKNFNYKGRFRPKDLLRTGEWRGKFTVTAGKKEAILFSQDRKDDLLTGEYGPDIHGVPRQQYPTIEEAILPILQESFAKEVTR